MRNQTEFPKFLSSLSSAPAFTGFCAEGRNRWTSCREVACQPDGAVSLHFNLTRKKGETLVYKVKHISESSRGDEVVEAVVDALMDTDTAI